jgi:hypothetical protein
MCAALLCDARPIFDRPIPVFAALGIVATVVSLTQFDSAVYLAGAVTVAVGVAIGLMRGVWAFVRGRRGMITFGSRWICPTGA